MPRATVKAVFLVFLLAIVAPIASYADVEGDYEGTEDGGSLVHYRSSEATNPKCGSPEYLAKIGGIVFGASLASAAVGAGLVKAGTVTLNKILKGIGWTMIAASVGAIAAGVTANVPYFVCNWSFVRHPVLRFEGNEKNAGRSLSGDYEEGAYKECKEPHSDDEGAKKKFSDTDQCNKEFPDLAAYYACIAPDKSLEDAKKAEPTCPKREFKKGSGSKANSGAGYAGNGYAWPKNRVSSSRYIEVCYRHPTASLMKSAFLMIGMQFQSKSYTDLLKEGHYPREGTFGDQEMHKAKLAVSGGWTRNKNAVDCVTLTAGQEGTLHGTTTYRAVERGSKLCVDAVKHLGAPLVIRPEIGCQLRPNSPPVPMCSDAIPKYKNGDVNKKEIVEYDNSNCYSCYVDQACKGVASLNARSVFPVTSVIVGCIKGSLKNLLAPPARCAAKYQKLGLTPGFLGTAQKKLKNSVMAALILALILFSIKAILGGVQNSSEIYMTVIKFALVIYFTQGDAMSKAYEYLTDLSIGLSDIVLKAAGGSNGICDFGTNDYDSRFLYLMPWDRLDCRVMFYLGSQLTGGTGTGILLTMLLSAGLLIPAVLINAKVIICLIAFFAVIMLVLTVIWTVYVFLLSLIALTVLTIISPLMIPMCLFQATKGFFDGWTRQLMTYALYPVILFAFLSLMFTVFDQLYFGDLKFKRGSDISQNSGAGSTGMKNAGKKIWFELIDVGACDKPEHESTLACMFNTVKFHSRPLLLGISVGTPEFKLDTTRQIWIKLGTFVLMGFLFYHFLSSISYIAGELAGDPRAGVIGSGGMNPRALANRAAGIASSVRSAASGKVSDLGSKLRDRIKGGGSDSGGSEKVSGGSQ